MSRKSHLPLTSRFVFEEPIEIDPVSEKRDKLVCRATRIECRIQPLERSFRRCVKHFHQAKQRCQRIAFTDSSLKHCRQQLFYLILPHLQSLLRLHVRRNKTATYLAVSLCL